MHLLYNFSIFLYHILLIVASPFNAKAGRWVSGRKNQKLPNLVDQKVIWMHCSSLGEFEQGKPVFDNLRLRLKDYTFVLSFFSPSGYERLKTKNDIADHIVYLPIDMPGKVQDFLNHINPEISIFVKYDFWFNYIREIKRRGIKLIFVSVLLSKNHQLFTWFNSFILKELKNINRIFTQNDNTYQNLSHKGFVNVDIAGDTRIDRVLEIASTGFQDDIIEQFCKIDEKDIMICGSTWENDINVISKIRDFILKKYKLIIAPHEIEKKQLDLIFSKFNGYKIALYSQSGNSDITIKDYDLFIIDKIGILSRIYRYAKIAYIGGGFGKGIHNTLEPGAYNIPVLLGPKYTKFIEAVTLVQKKGFFSINNDNELKNKISMLGEKKHYQQAQHEIKTFLNIIEMHRLRL